MSTTGGSPCLHVQEAELRKLSLRGASRSALAHAHGIIPVKAQECCRDRDAVNTALLVSAVYQEVFKCFSATKCFAVMPLDVLSLVDSSTAALVWPHCHCSVPSCSSAACYIYCYINAVKVIVLKQKRVCRLAP